MAKPGKQTFEIDVIDNETGGRTMKTVEGWIPTPHFGIDKRRTYYYFITHIPTGFMVMSTHRLRDARRFCKAAEKLEIDWDQADPSYYVQIQFSPAHDALVALRESIWKRDREE